MPYSTRNPRFGISTAWRRADAVLCLIDIRLPEAARIAARLDVRHLNPASAELLRDKYRVRCRLADQAVAQPDFVLADSNDQLKLAVDRLGLPVLIKPVDGYGSQNIVALRHAEDLDPLLSPLGDMLPSGADYGLGVTANDRMLVERYVFSALDAVGFDWGAAHTEVMLTQDGPRIIEINARLVGAKIGRLVGFALGRSIHADLIALHLGEPMANPPTTPPTVAVSRWITADEAGILDSVDVPAFRDERIRCVEILKQQGDPVRPPLENVDRIGYVMATGSNRLEAEELAKAFVSQCRCRISTPSNTAL